MKFWPWLLSICFSFLFTNSIFAQKKATYLKLYNYLPILGSTEYLGVEDRADKRVISLSSLGFSLHLENEFDRYREFEMSRFLFRQEDNGTSFIETSSGSLRYEYGAILKRKYNSIKVRLGGSLRYYYGNRNIIIFDNTIQETHGLIFSFTPHLDWRLHKNLYFDLAPDIQLLNGSIRLEDNFQPVTLPEEATAVDFFFQPFGLFLRMGISYRLK